jgi:hypothetical protein
MKKNLLIAIMAIFVFACSEDDIKELTPTTQSFSIDQDFNVVLTVQDPKSFELTKAFSAGDAVAVFGSNIQSVVITGITLDFTNYSSTVGPITITGMKMDFIGTGVSISLDPINLVDVSGKGIITLNISGLSKEAQTALETKLLNDKELSVTMSASVNDVPVTFDVNVAMDIDVTGTIL